MVTSCLFLRYDPSTLPPKVWNAGKVLMRRYKFKIFAFFQLSKWRAIKISTKLIPKGQIRKYFICSISFKQL